MNGETGIGDRIRQFRGSASQKETAQKIGISVAALQAYETGERIPRDEVKLAMARYFHTSIRELFFL